MLAREITVQLQPCAAVVIDREKPRKTGIGRKLMLQTRLVGPPEQAALLEDRHRRSSVCTAAAPRVSKSIRLRGRFQFSPSSSQRSSRHFAPADCSTGDESRKLL